jgi:hypothetical protein
MSAIQRRPDSREFGIDIGVNNMGMASVVITGDGRTVIEKLDWRPLLRRGASVNATAIVAAVGTYIDIITTPDLKGPFVANSSSAGDTSTRMIPNKIVIEQQYASEGINVHAIEIQIALMSRFAERFPSALVAIVGASARKCKTAGRHDQKARAEMIGRLFAGLDSAYWNSYLVNLSDPQHTCDAITMILDDIKFQNLPVIRSQVQIWEAQTPPIKRKAASAATTSLADLADPSEYTIVPGAPSTELVTIPSTELVAIPLPTASSVRPASKRGLRGKKKPTS